MAFHQRRRTSPGGKLRVSTVNPLIPKWEADSDVYEENTLCIEVLENGTSRMTINDNDGAPIAIAYRSPSERIGQA